MFIFQEGALFLLMRSVYEMLVFFFFLYNDSLGTDKGWDLSSIKEWVRASERY